MCAQRLGITLILGLHVQYIGLYDRPTLRFYYDEKMQRLPRHGFPVGFRGIDL